MRSENLSPKQWTVEFPWYDGGSWSRWESIWATVIHQWVRVSRSKLDRWQLSWRHSFKGSGTYAKGCKVSKLLTWFTTVFLLNVSASRISPLRTFLHIYPVTLKPDSEIPLLFCKISKKCLCRENKIESPQLTLGALHDLAHPPSVCPALSSLPFIFTEAK